MHDHDFHSLTILDVVPETPDSVSIALDVPVSLRTIFAYTSGQFLTVRRLVEGKMRLRCYSLCSSPHDDALLRIAVKRVPGGLVSSALCAELRPGDVLEVQPPAGMFTPASLQADFLLFAGGSGITPILSILKAALGRGSGRIALIYANRDETAVIFRDTLNALVTAHSERLVVLHWIESVQGLPDAAKLAALARPWCAAESFICGPEPFMNAVGDALAGLGVPDERVHFERFLSLPDEPPPPPLVNDGPEVALNVLIDYERHALQWSRNETLLATMLAAGLDPPYSCRVGGCSACMCRVTQGDVTMAANQVLDASEIGHGWVLACQSYPASDAVSVEV